MKLHNNSSIIIINFDAAYCITTFLIDNFDTVTLQETIMISTVMFVIVKVKKKTALVLL